MSTYTDVKNNTYRIIEYSRISDEEKTRVQEEVIEKLYNILMRK